jgi:GT2 family glycosyltransferase
MTNMSHVSIIIPSFNGQHLLAESIPALMKQTYPDFDVYVVDNGSRDDTVKWLRNEYPQVHIIENAENKGFAAAVNQGILSSDAPYVCTLNNDVVVDAEWIRSLVKAIESESDVGMCASKLLFFHKPSVINSSGICVDRAGIVWDREGGVSDSQRLDNGLNVFGPCAGAALYRRQMLDEIGLFDEEYFAYFEDVDLAWRARASGWRCAYVDSAIGYHHHSSTSVNGSRFKNFQLGKNKVRLLLKNFPFRTLWWYIPVILVYDVLAVGYQLAVNKAFQTLYGRIIGWFNAAKAISDRPSYSGRQDIPYISKMTWPWLVWKRFKHLSDMRYY